MIDEMPRRHIRNWDDWFDGKVHMLTQSEHFPEIDPEVFRRRAVSAARRRGYRIETSRAKGEPVIHLKRK